MTRRREQPCPVTTREIQRVFDGESCDPALLAHIERCDRCAARLADLRSRRDALAVLSGRGSGAGRLVRSARRAGLVALADGLAELVAALADLARAAGSPAGGGSGEAERERCRKAREAVRALAARLADEEADLARAVSDALPARVPVPSRAASVGSRLLDLLAGIEGETGRVSRLRARDGRPGT